MASSPMDESQTASTSTSQSVGSLVNFLTLIQSLKTTKRTGWINHGVAGPESIADHMYRMAMMAFMIDPKDAAVDRDRCIRMAIVHDVAEALVGDITPDDGISKEEKNRREAAAMEHMCLLLGETPQAQEMRDLWLEYDAASTLEAKLVKDFDKLEMILQAQEYEASQGKVLDDFFVAAGRIQTDIGKKLADEIVVRRPNKR
ncbi:HD domain containing protein [Klebsormidium nitens]|uniref:5'-deoxynucleotidase n=1 Tax=Klebsormidium nitens TaxID=105231 RepID=A0A1Y1IKZ6_KLENI|nr:HD domain containing protein [Klebsormidium nitens]|eukprot:GAQ89337.1 HD domain containing protein [Klebsormidium nitens]